MLHSALRVEGIVRLVLHLRKLGYVVAFASSGVLLVVVGSGRAVMFSLTFAVGLLVSFWGQSDSRRHLCVVLIVDSIVGLGLWWLDGPAAGGHFLLFYAVVVGALLLSRRNAAMVLIAAITAATGQIGLHFIAKTWGLPLFHSPDGVPDIKFVIGVGISVILLVAMTGLLVNISSLLSRGMQTEEHNEELKREVEERTKAQELAERLRNRNLSILNAAGQGIFGLSRDGRVTFVNPAACRLLGLEPEALMGQSIHALIHHSHVDGSEYPWNSCPVSQTLDTGQDQRITDEVFFRSDGGSFVVEYIVTSVHGGEDIVGAVVTFDDVTEARLMEARLAQIKKLESVGELAAGMAHEINTPMQYVADNAAFLEEALYELVPACVDKRDASGLTTTHHTVGEAAGPTGENGESNSDTLLAEIPGAFSDLQDGIERVMTIVQAMKKFSHPGGGERTPQNLNELVTNTVIVSRHEWEYVAELELELDDSLPPVFCDPSDISQAVLNIILNAAHAITDSNTGTNDKGRITVGTRLTEDWAEIIITDTGTGMPDSVRDKIFDPFFTTKEVGKGTGQGLTMANSTSVERHSGQLLVDSAIDEGTEFIIRLPLDRRKSSTAPRQESDSTEGD